MNEKKEKRYWEDCVSYFFPNNKLSFLRLIAVYVTLSIPFLWVSIAKYLAYCMDSDFVCLTSLTKDNLIYSTWVLLVPVLIPAAMLGIGFFLAYLEKKTKMNEKNILLITTFGALIIGFSIYAIMEKKEVTTSIFVIIAMLLTMALVYFFNKKK